MEIWKMRENQTNLEILLLNWVNILQLVPIVQLCAGLLTIVVVLRTIAKGVKEEGGFIKYLRSFLWW